MTAANTRRPLPFAWAGDVAAGAFALVVVIVSTFPFDRRRGSPAGYEMRSA
jgi:hypothetical protein